MCSSVLVYALQALNSIPGNFKKAGTAKQNETPRPMPPTPRFFCLRKSSLKTIQRYKTLKFVARTTMLWVFTVSYVKSLSQLSRIPPALSNFHLNRKWSFNNGVPAPHYRPKVHDTVCFSQHSMQTVITSKLLVHKYLAL